MAAIQNTLSRWHKVAGRAAERIREIDAEISALLAGRRATACASQDAAERARKDLEKARVLQLERISASRAVCAIRQALARANVEHGVSDLLAETERLRRDLAGYAEFSAWRDDGPKAMLAKARRLEERAEEARSSSAEGALEARARALDETIVFRPCDEEDAEYAKGQIKALKAQLTSISDRLSEANAAKLTIELDDDCAKACGAAA